VPGAQNPADALTKYFSHDLGRGHVESMGMEFRTDKPGGAIELNVLARSINWDQLGKELRQRGAMGKHTVWTRTDEGNRNYRTSAKGGPDWDKIAWRATFNEATGDMLDLESASGITREREHRPLCGRPIRTTTALISQDEDPTFRQAPGALASTLAPAEGECRTRPDTMRHSMTTSRRANNPVDVRAGEQVIRQSKPYNRGTRRERARNHFGSSGLLCLSCEGTKNPCMVAERRFTSK
jgi:hypothetical protein